MSHTTLLIGAEDVRSGGNAIERGAHTISSAAGTIEEAARRMEFAAQSIAESVARLEAALLAAQTESSLPDPARRAERG